MRYLRSACITLAMLGVLSGCGQSKLFEEKIETARTKLRLSEDTEALEILGVTNDAGAPAEFHYIKAVALDKLGRYEAAVAEIKRAITAAPEQPKYKGFELKLRLFARDRSSLDLLLKLNDDYGSVGAVALFATYGYQAKAMLLDAEQKPKAADYHFERQRRTLATALALAQEIPEFHRELITFALQSQQDEEAMKLIDGILKVAPQNVPMRNKKLQVLLQQKKPDEAIAIARELFDETRRTAAGAEAFAAVLALGSVNEANDTTFKKLIEEFPRDTQILCRYAAYLTRSGRILEAFKLLEGALPGQTTKSNRETIAYVLITLPLEIGSVDYTEEQLRKYRGEISDPLLHDYFDARLLYLKRQYHDAVQKMLNIVSVEKKNPGQSTALAKEALSWVRRILSDRVLTEQLGMVLDQSGKKVIAPDVRVETPSAADPKREPGGSTNVTPKTPAVPDSGKPDSGKLDQGKPDLKKPAVETPESAKPEPAKPTEPKSESKPEPKPESKTEPKQVDQ